MFFQSLSQLTLTALFTKESLAIRSVKMLIFNRICNQTYFQPNIAYKQNVFSISQSADADSSLYQREPALRFVWAGDLWGKLL